MGEKIKDLSKIKFNSKELVIELNEAPNRGQERDIHLQNDFFRVSLDESEFFKMACCFLYAKTQLERIKEVQNNE